MAQAGLYSIDDIRVENALVGDSKDGQLRILPSTIVVKGNFRAFVALLDGLRRHGAGLMVQGVSIEPVKKRESGAPKNLFTITFAHSACGFASRGIWLES